MLSTRGASVSNDSKSQPRAQLTTRIAFYWTLTKTCRRSFGAIPSQWPSSSRGRSNSIRRPQSSCLIRSRTLEEAQLSRLATACQAGAQAAALRCLRKELRDRTVGCSRRRFRVAGRIFECKGQQMWHANSRIDSPRSQSAHYVRQQDCTSIGAAFTDLPIDHLPVQKGKHA
jgi:hypothetical protein